MKKLRRHEKRFSFTLSVWGERKENQEKLEKRKEKDSEKIHKSLLQAVIHTWHMRWFSGTLILFVPPPPPPPFLQITHFQLLVHFRASCNTTNLQQINFYEVKKEFCYMISISSQLWGKIVQLSLFMRSTKFCFFFVLRPLIIYDLNHFSPSISNELVLHQTLVWSY